MKKTKENYLIFNIQIWLISKSPKRTRVIFLSIFFGIAFQIYQICESIVTSFHKQSSDGEYKKMLPFQPGPLNWGCIAFAEFCTDTNFKGDCQIYNDSQRDLGVFAQKAVSANINGTCAWQVFTEAQYEGPSVTLIPGDFEILDRLLNISTKHHCGNYLST